jgi:hypothetical protein
VFLSALPAGRAANRGIFGVRMSTRSGSWELPVLPVPGLQAFTLAPISFPAEVPANTCRVAVHELGHSLGLGDEYVEAVGDYPNQDETFDFFANLQTRKSAQRDGTDENGQPTRVIHGDEVKWNWHRITRAGVITGLIKEDSPGSGRFGIPIRPGHAAQFQEHDRVLLRAREAGTPLTKRPVALHAGQELQVMTRPVDSLTVEPVTAGSVTADDLKKFGPGCIAYVATSAPESVRAPDYPYAEMVALNIKKYMTDKKRGLTDPCGNKFEGVGSYADLAGFPGTPVSFDTSLIVGLFEGGAQYTCGVFHPTGSCMMNNDSQDGAAFCPVCRYVIVDMIDPFYHWDLDRDYSKIYPQT